MKKIDALILKSFLGPYILSFFVAEFVLVMQFMWKYIDEILGKGFSMLDILELVFYYGLMIVPMALPISILIASVMVFGNLAEKYEMPAMKSAGISLMRIMAPGIVLAMFTFAFSVFASNYLKPVASFQFKKRFEVIRKQKSSLLIEEKVFNEDFDDFVIRVQKKYPNDVDMKEVIMYDQSRPDRTLLNMIKSDSARMFTDSSGRYFVMDLINGNIYQEEPKKRNENGKTSYPLVRTAFGTYHKVLDMSEFTFDKGNLDINRNKEDMLNTFQLMDAIDSLNYKQSEQEKRLNYDYHDLLKVNPDPAYLYKVLNSKVDKSDDGIAENDTIASIIPKSTNAKIDTVQNASLVPDALLKSARDAIVPITATQVNVGIIQKSLQDLSIYKSFRETLDPESSKKVLSRASSIISSRIELAVNVGADRLEFSRMREMYYLRLFQQYSFGFICIVFLFIGAPLGSIIRKGGYGYPFLIAILFYMVFIITTIMGEKLTKNQTYSGFEGAWISTFILAPIAIYVTYKAQKDAKFEALKNAITVIKQFFIKVFSSKNKKKAIENIPSK
ncbi:MAG: LptF/LptG family permease [Saprospiraceae bacterium]|nr:LptF/LptG family permease [Saprospiraceae bacterium]